MDFSVSPASAATPATHVWQVGALCRAVADALEARFNPVTVRGEISSFSRAASGHCYFSLRDGDGQIRCAMFRRAAGLLDFAPRDGELVEVRGRLGVYEQRGDLQLIVESMGRAGAGTLFEEFLQRKARLEAEGLFDAARKRPLPLLPRGIGLVTSLGAAALHDVVTALQRRVPHIPVVLAPAAVQGAGAPAELVRALSNLYHLSERGRRPGADFASKIDVILLVRGGGALEDLWAFNDEALARCIAASPVPVICGVGHETDFTIADFVADLRAPTPTAAAELVTATRDTWLGALELLQGRQQDAAQRLLDRQNQRLDRAAARLGRPSLLMARQQQRLAHQGQRLQFALRAALERKGQSLRRLEADLPARLQSRRQRSHDRLERAALRLGLLDPQLVLQRGYAWLSNADGQPVTRAAQTAEGQPLRATLFDGEVDLTVAPARRI
ncbi:MAG: exodeoxyribonuclease VII large subunit [Pseudomonadota bacterium]